MRKEYICKNGDNILSFDCDDFLQTLVAPQVKMTSTTLLFARQLFNLYVESMLNFESDYSINSGKEKVIEPVLSKIHEKKVQIQDVCVNTIEDQVDAQDCKAGEGERCKQDSCSVVNNNQPIN